MTEAREAPVSTMSTDEQHDHDSKHPPLPGSKEHNCTDVFWLVFLFLNLGALAYIQYYAAQNGNARKLTRGFNSDKELCGVHPNTLNKPYIFWCEDPSTGDITSKRPICVEHCPDGKSSGHMDGCGTFVVGNETLQANVYKSLEVGHWCVPRAKKETAILLRKVFGNYTLAPVLTVYGDLQRTGSVILPMAALISIVVGYVYLYLLDKCAQLLCYLCMLLLIGSTGGLGSYLVWCALTSDPTTYTPMLYEKHADLVAGAVLMTVGLLSMFLFCCQSYGIETACGCIEASCECLIQEPTLLIEPFLALIIKVGTLSVMALGFTAVASTGEVKLTGDSGIRRDITWSNEEYAYMSFYIFIFVWMMEMASASSQYVLAWTTQMWYFTPYVNDHKEDRMPCGVLEGYFNLIRYHLGTVALGSLLIAYCRLVRIALGALVEASRMEGNPVAKLLSTCCFCCVSCFERFLESLNKNAYMDVAVTSSSFCAAAGRAMDLLTTEVPAVKALNGTQFIFQICGVGLITCSTCWSMMAALSSFQMFSEYSSPYYVSNRIGVCVVVGAQAVFIALCFMHVFDTVGDTILYCFASETRRRGKVDPKAYGDKAEHEASWWGWLVGEDEDSSDEDLQVNYAPKKLKALVERHTDS